MRKTQLVVVLILSSWGSCYADDSDADKALIDEMRSITTAFMQKLGKTLKTTIQSEGAKSAIHVCQTVAPEIANQLSRETGWKVSRVSLKVRNPLIGTPDDWEREQLRHFSKVTVSVVVCQSALRRRLSVTALNVVQFATCERYQQGRYA